jgi:heme exporter protein A
MDVTGTASGATLAAMALDFERVEARGLVKTFGVTRALNGVDATFEAGTLTAIEGANGSGKSTLLSLLGLIARPTSGELRYGSYDAAEGANLRGRIGLLAHNAIVYPDLTGAENLDLFARLYQVASSSERLQEVCDRFEIGAWYQRPARTYSRGQLQRLALARALLHKPRLLLLDEPSTGLDDAAVERLVSALAVERRGGAIAIMATHDRLLAERVSDRRLTLRQGRVVQIP